MPPKRVQGRAVARGEDSPGPSQQCDEPLDAAKLRRKLERARAVLMRLQAMEERARPTVASVLTVKGKGPAAERLRAQLARPAIPQVQVTTPARKRTGHPCGYPSGWLVLQRLTEDELACEYCQRGLTIVKHPQQPQYRYCCKVCKKSGGLPKTIAVPLYGEKTSYARIVGKAPVSRSTVTPMPTPTRPRTAANTPRVLTRTPSRLSMSSITTTSVHPSLIAQVEEARLTTTVPAPEQPWAKQRAQLRKEAKDVDVELLAHLRIKALGQPRIASLFQSLAGHAQRFMADNPAAKTLSEEVKYRIIARAVYAAMVIPQEEIEGRQFLKSAKALEQAHKHAKMVTEGNLGKRGVVGWVTGKTVSLPKPKA
jgi:hypothetical protein